MLILQPTSPHWGSQIWRNHDLSRKRSHTTDKLRVKKKKQIFLSSSLPLTYCKSVRTFINSAISKSNKRAVISWISKQNSFEMFVESVYCQIGVAHDNRKVVPRTRTSYCEWSVTEGVVAALYDADLSVRRMTDTTEKARWSANLQKTWSVWICRRSAGASRQRRGISPAHETRQGWNISCNTFMKLFHAAIRQCSGAHIQHMGWQRLYSAPL